MGRGTFRRGADSSDEGAKIWFSGYNECQNSPTKSLFTFRRGGYSPLALPWRHPGFQYVEEKYGNGLPHLLCFMFVVKLDKKVYGCENMPDLNSSLYAYRCLQCFSALHHACAYRLLSIPTSYGKVLYFLYSRIINSGIISRFLRNPFKRRLQIYLGKTRIFFFLCSCRKEHGVSMPQATAKEIMTPC